MRKFMDELENAAFKLRDRCKEAVQNASVNFEKARPTIQENIDKVREEVGDAFEKAKPTVKEGLDKVADVSQSAFEKVKPGIESGLEKFASACGKAAADLRDGEPQEGEKPDRPLSAEEQLNLEVEEQVEKIRTSQITPTSISDFISQKYGKKQD